MICLRSGVEARKQRQYDYKTPKANSFLIVTEGERTEPLYFKGLQKLILENMGGVVDVVVPPVIDIHGEGCSTSKLIEVAEQLVKDSKIMYHNVWIQNKKALPATQFPAGIRTPLLTV